MNEHISFDDLSRRTDDLLPPAQRAEVDAHLAECEACRREFETLLWINETVKSVPWQPLPAGVSFHVPVEENWLSAFLRGLGWGRSLAFAAVPALLLLFAGVVYCGSPAGAQHKHGDADWDYECNRQSAGRPQPGGSTARSVG